MAQFNPTGGSGGATSSVVITGAQTPTIANISIPLANTEVSYSLPSNTKQFEMKLRGFATLKVAFISGDSGTTYWTVNPGTMWEVTGLTVSGLTVYFQSDSAGQTAEITSWV